MNPRAAVAAVLVGMALAGGTSLATIHASRLAAVTAPVHRVPWQQDDARAPGAMLAGISTASEQADAAAAAAMASTGDDPVDAQAVQRLQRAIESYRLARQSGRYVQAVERFADAAGTSAGRLGLAYLVGFGLGVERNERQARQLLLGARGPYQPRAWYLLGLLDERSPAPGGAARAQSWFACAAQAGDELALNHLGTLLEKDRRLHEAAGLYREAAQRGVSEAQGNAWRVQQAAREQPARGDLARLRARARAADPHAMFALARAFHRGQGVAADYTEALHWYRQAAQRGHVEAQLMLRWILAKPLTARSIDPAWMHFLASHRPDGYGGLALIASRQRPLTERDPLQGLDTLHSRPFPDLSCEVTP